MAESARPHTQRLRHLAAMGIDVYVRRDLQTAPEPAPHDATDAVAAPQSEAAPAASLADVHAALAEPSTIPPSAGTQTEEPTPPAIEADVTAAPAPESAASEAPSTTSAPPVEAIGPPPRFRLFALRFGAALLLVDEMALPETRRETQQRLGDLVRTAGLLSGGVLAPARELEVQTFYWPQIEAQHVDQSAPRATEALLAWVNRCTDDGAGVLVVVDAPPAAIPGDAVAPLAALEMLPVRRARIDASFLTQGGGPAQRAAWAALSGLAGAS